MNLVVVYVCYFTRGLQRVRLFSDRRGRAWELSLFTDDGTVERKFV